MVARAATRPGAASPLRAFLSIGGVPRLVLACLLARLPLGMTGLGVVLAVRERSGSFAIAGLVAGVFAIANAAITPLQGRLMDRRGPARLLIAFALGHGVALLAFAAAIAGAAPIGLLFVLAPIAGVLTPTVSAVSRGLWPRLTGGDADQLRAAYAFDAISQELLWMLGPLIVAAVASLASPALALVFSASFTALGGLWFALAPAVRATPGLPRRPGQRRPLADAGLRRWVAAMALIGLGTGALDLATTGLAARLGAPDGAGLLLGGIALGSALGGVAHARGRWTMGEVGRFRRLLAACAVAVVPLALAPSMAVAVPLSVVAGLGWAAVFTCQFAMVNAAAPAGALTESFTWNTSALVVGAGTGTAVAGVLVHDIGTGAGFALVSVATLCAAAVTFRSPALGGAPTAAA